MKRILFFLGLISTISVCAQPPITATFEVDLSLYQGTYSTVEFYRAGSSYLMTSSGGNIYTYTATVPPGASQSNSTYKFKVDGVFESFTTLLSCLTIVNNDTLRTIDLTTTTPSIVCWESCNTCVTVIPGCTDVTAINYTSFANLDNDSCQYNITFIVDMSETDDPFVEAEVYGDFNNWCGGCAPMTDINNDSIWEITIPLMVGNYEYKFAADTVNIEESLYESDNCVVTAWGFTNRVLNVTGNQTLDTICWNRCYSCDTERNFYNVTFQVDMSNVTSTYTAPEVNGTFNNWCGNCWQLDPQFNNIYSRSFNVDTSLHTFKFSADNWLIQEDIDSNLSCILINYDTASSNGWGNVNRELKLISDTIIDVCWESCNTCPIFGCTNPSACNYDSLATLDDGSCLTVYGCMNLIALNYDSLATCPDSCFFFQIIYGCTDSMACNFNILANTDDSSCLLNYGCMDSLAYNYDSLAVCFDSSCVYEYNVTFQLDLRGQTNISYTTPEINGLFNGWCGNCAELTDLNNDSIWEITVPILEGSGPVSGVPGWEYKFSADNWNIQENLFSGDPCTFSAFGYTNRYINVTQDTILDPVCWQSCNDCYAPQTAYNVTFRLDMSNNSNFSVPEVNGEFNSWCGNCWPMTDDDGDNIWEFNTLIDTAKHEYKFSADNWGIQEQLDSSANCVFTTVDSLGNVFSNRYLHINSDTILDVVCWNECDTCLTTTSLIPNENDNSYTIFPNPSTGIFYIKSSDKIDKVIVYDILNKKMLEKNNPGTLQPFNISDINSSILFLEIYINDKVVMDKLIITK